MRTTTGPDSRRVQTAVLGDEHSELPIVLPMEAIEVDRFRQAHHEDTFWCGVWLGGCGSRLTTKLYTDRACHSAHVPPSDGSTRESRASARTAEWRDSQTPHVAQLLDRLAAARDAGDRRQVRVLCERGDRMSRTLVGEPLVTLHAAVACRTCGRSV